MSLGAATLVLVFGVATARAQEEGEDGVVYKKKTVISFDDDTIDGDLMRPDGAYVEARKRLRHSNLIRIREDFRVQILNSVTKL
ncbi:MAG: adventurous gliding motility protein CglF [Deltaproteobacteria bacterium]|nr:adventurous gliding motility protein CglF [Deltaproteobacteria bacterium]